MLRRRLQILAPRGHHSLANLFFGDAGSHGTSTCNDEAKTARSCRHVALAGGVTNCTFAFVKIGLGSTDGGSTALLADGMHAAVDLCADTVSFIAVSTRRWQFSRCRWPFGPGRLETVASLFISLMLVSGSIAILRATVSSLWTDYMYISMSSSNQSSVISKPPAPVHEDHGHHHSHSHGGCGGSHGHSHFDAKAAYQSSVEGNSEAAERQRWLFRAMIAASLASLVAKEGLYRWGKRVGEKAGSAVLVANAMHHRADAWSSAVALTGVVGVAAGFPLMDQVAGIAVSTAVLRVGCKMSLKAGQELLDYQPLEYEKRSGTVNRCFAPESQTLFNRSQRAVLVNVGVVRHGHTLHVNGLLVVPPKAPSDLVAQSAQALEMRFKNEFGAYCPDVELRYQVMVVDPLLSNTATSSQVALDAAPIPCLDVSSIQLHASGRELIEKVATYHRLDNLETKFKEAVVHRGQKTSDVCAICGEPLADPRPCLRDLEAICYFYGIQGDCKSHVECCPAKTEKDAEQGSPELSPVVPVPPQHV